MNESKTVVCTGCELDHELQAALADGWKVAGIAVLGGGDFEIQLVRAVEVDDR